MVDSVKLHEEIEVTANQTIGYELKPEVLYSMFEPDNIKDGESLSILRELGGVHALEDLLKTNFKNGLNTKDERDIIERQTLFGKNTPITKKTKGFFKFCLESFEDLMLRIIAVASIISLVIGYFKDPSTGWMEGLTIFVAVIIIVLITAGNNYNKELQFAKLYRKMEEKTIEVSRNGVGERISLYDLMVGDVLDIEIGDVLPVDGILVKSNDILMDESSVTGESDLIKKAVPKSYGEKMSKITPFMISGSKVMDGSGRIVVGAVGVNTQSGKLRLKLQEDTPKTPLQVKLDAIATDIGKFGLIISSFTVAFLISHIIIDHVQGEICFFCVDTGKEFVDALLICIAILVMAVPEGLPLAVTLTLAYSVGKMKDENNLVRQIQSCEIMGGANNICSDKTGTLTQNKMSVTNLFLAENEYAVNNMNKDSISKDTVGIFCKSICVNSTANPKLNPDGTFEQIGNKTECAILELAHKFGYNYRDFRPSDDIKKVLPFSSARKRMITVFQDRRRKCYQIFVKGAPEMIIEYCKYYVGKNGTTELDETFKSYIIDKVVLGYAKQSLRTILTAYAEVPIDSISAQELETWPEEEMLKNLIMIGITGIKDPLRPEIVEAIQKCKKAGITVRMVTGDNFNTAVAISKECGILYPDYEYRSGSYEALEGKNFREMIGGLVYDPIPGNKEGKTMARIKNFKKFKAIAKELKVLARSTPEDKYILVTGLRQLDHIVAVTGDGTNDAPALKKADVGFAMGIAGTDVAKEAAGIILLDDNFNSIVTACKWGRNIYDSIRKFIQFQLTINISGLTLAFVGAVVNQKTPLTSNQILWINLINNTFAALALATERPALDVLERKPYSRKEYIVTPMMWRGILFQAAYQLIVLGTWLFAGPAITGLTPGYMNYKPWNVEKGQHMTIFFNSFVFCQMFNEINCRKLKKTDVNVFKGIFDNLLFLVIMAVQLCVQLLMVEFGGYFVKCSPLTWQQHLLCVGIGSLGLLNAIIVKSIPERFWDRILIFRDIKNWDDPEEVKTPLRI